MTDTLDWAGPYEEPPEYNRKLIPRGLYKAIIHDCKNLIDEKADAKYTSIIWRIPAQGNFMFEQRCYYAGKTDVAHKISKDTINRLRLEAGMKDASAPQEFIGAVVAIYVKNDGKFNNVSNIFDIQKHPELDEKVANIVRANESIPW